MFVDSGGRGLRQLVTADTPWCNRGAVSLGGRGLRQLVTADTPWCNRSAVSQLILPGVTAARLAVLTVRRRFGGRGLLWGPPLTQCGSCSPLGDKLGDLQHLGQSSCSDGTAES